MERMGREGKGGVVSNQPVASGVLGVSSPHERFEPPTEGTEARVARYFS